MRILLARAVHLFTASGAVLAFLALEAVVRADFRRAFAWLFVSTIIDGLDGWFARLARVREHTPYFDGARLDDIVDYLTFVFVPAVLIYRAGLLPDGLGVWVVAAVLLSSAYGFSRHDAKTDDYFFTGFPSYWNIVALYLYAGGLPRLANAAVILFLSLMVFVRIGYIYPNRTPAFRTVTVGLGLLWGAAVVAIIASLPEVSRPLVAGSLLFPVYYMAMSFVLHARRETRR